MLGTTEEQIEECPHCHKRIVLSQFHYDAGGSSKISVDKVDPTK